MAAVLSLAESATILLATDADAEMEAMWGVARMLSRATFCGAHQEQSIRTEELGKNERVWTSKGAFRPLQL
jgi:hypothetical protein